MTDLPPEEERSDEELEAAPPPPPRSPYTLDENVEYMRADDVMAVRLGGATVGDTSIAMDIAVPFLYRLHTLVAVIAARLTGREAGTRGPAPEVPEAGLLSFTSLAPAASVVFRFGLGPGERFQMTPEGETSPTQEVIKVVTSFLEASEELSESELFELAQALGARVASNYFNLVQTLRQSGVDTTWETKVADRPIRLSAVQLRRVEDVLDREAPPDINEQVLRGWLYRADAREHKFLFEREDNPGERLPGTYPPQLRKKVKDAWDQLVEIRAVATEYRLLRQADPVKIELELLDVTRVIGEHG